jgi:hypothetical protein
MQGQRWRGTQLIVPARTPAGLATQVTLGLIDTKSAMPRRCCSTMCPGAEDDRPRIAPSRRSPAQRRQDSRHLISPAGVLAPDPAHRPGVHRSVNRARPRRFIMATAPTRRRISSSLFWVTEASAGTNHLVTEAAFTDGMRACGSYRGVCGVQFSAAPMIDAPRGTCGACRGVIAVDRTRCRRTSREVSWWRRLPRRNPRHIRRRNAITSLSPEAL